MDTQRLLLRSVLLWAHSEAEVVDSVSECAEFFLLSTPPVIPGVLENRGIMDQNRYKPICQTYKDHRRFFTLYDVRHKIPVFSFYIFKGNDPRTRRPNGFWTTEPQLEINMEKKCGQNIVFRNQASFNDYKNQLDFDRGHLYPSSYGKTQEDKESTFTLTNAVPQAKTFNQGSWNRMENCTKCVMKKHCINSNKRIEGFLVTGAEPGNNVLKNKKKMNSPSAMWSAFCCYSSTERKWIASAFWGRNVPDERKDKYMETETLNQLKFRKTSAFELFPGTQCPPDTTVTELYPELNDQVNCNWPPTATTTASPNTTNTTTAITTTQPHCSVLSHKSIYIYILCIFTKSDHKILKYKSIFKFYPSP
ncbi:endonuclease domain-containing 1 protein-like [Eucyclogobius newberryi]|uniref:endonuclease domain-containing 1 protein-like n=1 Tax=Eucyclogobius newberryi TaxID=166745 RepID=UPI003B5C315D